MILRLFARSLCIAVTPKWHISGTCCRSCETNRKDSLALLFPALATTGFYLGPAVLTGFGFQARAKGRRPTGTPPSAKER